MAAVLLFCIAATWLMSQAPCQTFSGRAAPGTMLLQETLTGAWLQCCTVWLYSIWRSGCRFVAGLQHAFQSWRKPFNPILGAALLTPGPRQEI